ncbi:MAG: thioredoxin domain-containing protein [Clostridia bacterium]|jgi:thioredoxin 1|nr:thioredoxin domain-containing protein [Clostridia bacterium]MCI1999065.1 thioredoxin domain-containing protein [Clostridia bacterium]MCI2013815.1 thioredoxin domain-containing protein [Clostridia bacterium]
MTKTIDISNFETEVSAAHLPIMADFYAEWCGPCAESAKMVNDIEKKTEGKMKVIRVDVDENAEICEKYCIKSVPTFIFFSDGEIQKQLTGCMDEEVFESEVDDFLGL